MILIKSILYSILSIALCVLLINTSLSANDKTISLSIIIDPEKNVGVIEDNLIISDAFTISLRIINISDKPTDEYDRKNIEENIKKGLTTSCKDSAKINPVQIGTIKSETYMRNIKEYVKGKYNYENCMEIIGDNKKCQVQYYKVYYEAIKKYEGTESVVAPSDALVMDVEMAMDYEKAKKHECTIQATLNEKDIFKNREKGRIVSSNILNVPFNVKMTPHKNRKNRESNGKKNKETPNTRGDQNEN